jgi:lipopolysaccharide/colanic/teichoic acid biosynthesis glycosyltransferase
MRKLWLDEQPMWYNWLRREMKLVGLRPLSEQYFTLYPDEFRKRRINYKLGIIPPFNYDLTETIGEIVESEKKYLDAYNKYPWLKDIRYFFVALYNIIMKCAKSA